MQVDIYSNSSYKSMLNVLIAVLLFIFSTVYHGAKDPENDIRYISMGLIIRAKLGSQANTEKINRISTIY